jgi:hypothetical protein
MQQPTQILNLLLHQPAQALRLAALEVGLEELEQEPVEAEELVGSQRIYWVPTDIWPWRLGWTSAGWGGQVVVGVNKWWLGEQVVVEIQVMVGFQAQKEGQTALVIYK